MAVIANVSDFPWLTFDLSSSILSGTAPDVMDHQMVPVIPIFISCTFPRQTLMIATNLTLSITEPFFNETALPVLQVALGMKIEYSFSPFIKLSPGWSVSVTFIPDNLAWLSFDSENLTLNGTVPQESPTHILVSLLAKNDLDIEVNKTRNTIRGHGGNDLPTKIKLSLGLIFGILAAIIVVVVVLALRRRSQPPPPDFGIATSYKPPPPIKHVYASHIIRAFTRLSSQNVSKPQPVPDRGHGLFKGLRQRFNFGREDKSDNGSSGSSFRIGGGSDSDRNGSGAPARPRKSKIGKPIAFLTNSTDYLMDFMNVGRAGNMRYTQSQSQDLTHSPDFPSSQIVRPSHPEPQSSPDPHPLPLPSPTMGMPRMPAPMRVGAGAGTVSGLEPDATNTSATTTDDGRPLRVTNAAGDVPVGRAGFGGQPSETLPQKAQLVKREAEAARKTRTSTIYRNSRSPDHSTPAPATGTEAGDKDRIRREAVQRAMMAVAAGQSEQERQRQQAQSQGAFLPPHGLRRAETTTKRSGTKTGGGSESGAPKASYAVMLPPAVIDDAVASGSGFGGVSVSGSGKIPASMLPKHSSYKGNPRRSLISPNVNLNAAGNASTMSLDTPNPFSPDANMNASRQPQLTARRVNFGDSSLEDIDTEAEMDLVYNQFYAQAGPQTQKRTYDPPARLVPFKHERIRTSGQGTHNVCQKALVHPATEGDTLADIMVGLEYMRRQPDVDGDERREACYDKGKGKGKAITSRHTRDHSEEYYASNESDATTDVVAHLPSPLTVTPQHSFTEPHPIPSGALSHPSEDKAGAYSDILIMQYTIPPCTSFNFKISIFDVFSPLTRLVAKQHNGCPLPGWLSFDSGANEFWGVTPDVKRGEVVTVEVDVWGAVGETLDVVGGVDLLVIA
ncbi:hypothetical protein BU17DRAFT_67111 [Hysterangium stoloniferum]|nr:hypothetical protein BU17DRAFT_67111 [Hysterangium stoloniferum]